VTAPDLDRPELDPGRERRHGLADLGLVGAVLLAEGEEDARALGPRRGALPFAVARRRRDLGGPALARALPRVRDLPR
jgi:hypothetical protein